MGRGGACVGRLAPTPMRPTVTFSAALEPVLPMPWSGVRKVAQSDGTGNIAGYVLSAPDPMPRPPVAAGVRLWADAGNPGSADREFSENFSC